MASEKSLIVDDFPSNSHKKKKEEPVEKKKVEKIIKGTVVKPRKTFGRKVTETVFGEDTKSVGSYIFSEVLIPAAKDTIVDMVKGGIEMLVHGERQSRSSSRNRGRGHVSYGSFYRNDRDEKREVSRSVRSRHNFDELPLETREDALEVLAALVDLTVDYGMASVADFYDLVGVTPDYTDNKYGWTDLENVDISRRGRGYVINLPRTKEID